MSTIIQPTQGSLLKPWQIYTLEDALHKPEQPWEWTIEDLLLKQAALLQSGLPHSMKSLAWLAAAMGAPIEGKVWGHFPSAAQRTLFIETEDPKQVLQKRIRELACGFNLKPDKLPSGFNWARTGPFNLMTAKDQLRRTLEDVKPDFMVLSTLQGLLAGRDWNVQQDMSPVNSLIVELSADYCPIVLVTHSPQDRSAKRAAGTITQEANYLTTMHFEKKLAIARVTMDSKLDIGQRFELKLETEGKEVRRVIYHESTKRQQIEDFIRSFGSNPPTWEDIVEEFKVSREYAQRVLREVLGGQK